MTDFRQLHADALKFETEQSKSRSSRERTGTTKAIRAALGHIYRLREDGIKWSAIAAALAAQGIVQGKARVPLTTNRLTALVRQIEVQNQKRAAKKEVIAEQKDIAMQNRGASLSSAPVKKTRAVGADAPRLNRRSQQVAHSQGQAEPAGERMASAKEKTSRARIARSEAAGNTPGPSKSAVKSAAPSQRDVLAFMDRTRAIRSRQE